MKIAIIGSNGFLSNSIYKFCVKQNFDISIYGLNKPKEISLGTFHYVNLVNESLNIENLKSSDIIFYTAGAGIQSNLKEDINLIYSLNVIIPINIITNLNYSGFKGRFITFGSYFEVGKNEIDTEFNELDIITSLRDVVNDYSISKRLLSRYIHSIKKKFNVLHFILPTIYGENESQHRLIPYVIDSIRNNKSLYLTSGEQIRQYIYIDEVVDIVFKAIFYNIESGIYNISGAETLSVKEVVYLLFRLFNKDISDNIFGQTTRIDSSMKILKLDGNKLFQSINYNPKIKISNVYERYE